MIQRTLKDIKREADNLAHELEAMATESNPNKKNITEIREAEKKARELSFWAERADSKENLV